MKIPHSHLLSQFRLSLSLGLAAFAVIASTQQLRAASGNELFMSSLSSSDMNKTIVDCEALNEAVTKAVSASPEQAPEVVAVAVTKTRSLACQRSLVQASIRALGNYKALPKNLIPNIVGAAVRASSNCGYGDNTKSGYAKSDLAGCECAEQFTKAAIETLVDPSERLVSDITAAAIQATGGKCADAIVAAASSVAPQFASAIADIGSRAATGGPNTFDGGDPLVYGPTGVPLPSAFTLPSNAPGIVSSTTPVLNN